MARRSKAEIQATRDQILLKSAQPRDYADAAEECEAIFAEDARGWRSKNALELAAAVLRASANAVHITLPAKAVATEGGQ